MEIGKWEAGGGGLKIFGRKGGGKAKWGWVCLEMRGCHIILSFFWRFLMMWHRKNI